MWELRRRHNTCEPLFHFSVQDVIFCSVSWERLCTCFWTALSTCPNATDALDRTYCFFTRVEICLWKKRRSCFATAPPKLNNVRLLFPLRWVYRSLCLAVSCLHVVILMLTAPCLFSACCSLFAVCCERFVSRREQSTSSDGQLDALSENYVKQFSSFV